MVVHNPLFESATLSHFRLHRSSHFRVARRAGLFARAGPRALMPERRSKPYCRKELTKTTIAEKLRTVIYLNRLERENLERKLAAALARCDKLRDARLAELRAELGWEAQQMGALRSAVFSTLDPRCKALKESHRRLDRFPYSMKDVAEFGELLDPGGFKLERKRDRVTAVGVATNHDKIGAWVHADEVGERALGASRARADGAVSTAVTVHFKLTQMLKPDAWGVRREFAPAPAPTRGALRSIVNLGCTLADSQQAPAAHCQLTPVTRAAFAADAPGARGLKTLALEKAALSERVRELESNARRLEYAEGNYKKLRGAYGELEQHLARTVSLSTKAGTVHSLLADADGLRAQLAAAEARARKAQPSCAQRRARAEARWRAAEASARRHQPRPLGPAGQAFGLGDVRGRVQRFAIEGLEQRARPCRLGRRVGHEQDLEGGQSRVHP
jgi:hypothetical protein